MSMYKVVYYLHLERLKETKEPILSFEVCKEPRQSEGLLTNQNQSVQDLLDVFKEILRRIAEFVFKLIFGALREWYKHSGHFFAEGHTFNYVNQQSPAANVSKSSFERYQRNWIV